MAIGFLGDYFGGRPWQLACCNPPLHADFPLPPVSIPEKPNEKTLYLSKLGGLP